MAEPDDPDKPYRVYRSGRTRSGGGRLPGNRRPGARSPHTAAERNRGGDAASPRSSRDRRRRVVILSLIVVASLAALILVWGVIGFVMVESGASGANRRLSSQVRAALTPGGSLLFSPSNILLLSVDHSATGSIYRQTDNNRDAMMLLRTEPAQHRIVALSIPRDLRVPLPGYGYQKINSAMQFGGAALAIKAVEQVTGLTINHVAIVDFSNFENLINTLGGIEIDVPENILSNRFDCPYATEARCLAWPGWRFHKGWQHMNGHQALIYSRIRDNQLNPSDTDITREEHEQQVMEAVMSKLASLDTFLKLPFDGSSLLAPITTDLSAFDFLELGWDKFRAGSMIHCRLGGTPLDIGGEAYLQPSPANASVIQMVLGKAPLEPPPTSSLYAPGCLTGNPFAP